MATEVIVGFMASVNESSGRGGGVASLDLVDAVRKGLPISAFEEAVSSDRLTAAELEKLGVSVSARRRHAGRLSTEQSDRLVRILRVIAEAEQTFANAEKARQWLRLPTAALAGRTPLELLHTDVGARRVETLLGHIGHGIAA